MDVLESVLLVAALASPVIVTAQTPDSTAGSSSGPTASKAAEQAERDRPQGGSTAGANGRQDPTIKLSNGKSDGAHSGSSSQQGGTASAGQRSRPDQGESSVGANGRQDPTIKSEPAPQRPQTSQ